MMGRAILATFLWAPSLWACQAAHIKNAEEITREAQIIVLAKVTGYERGPSLSEGTIELKVMEVLKGWSLRWSLRVTGQTERYEGRKISQGLHGGPPYHSVRDGGTHGNCYALDDKPDGQFPLFLRGGTPYWAPLAATNEEVSGPDDPWVA